MTTQPPEGRSGQPGQVPEADPGVHEDAEGGAATSTGDGPDDVAATEPDPADHGSADAADVRAEDDADRRTEGAADDRVEDADDETVADVVVERPLEAATPVRGPLALTGTGVTGFLMGTADVVPGFSGGTVALVVGIYERLIANVRQGARALSLLVRGRPPEALRALLAIEWPFVGVLLAGIFAAILTLAGPLERLSDEHPSLLRSVFLGLVLGAAVVASRELRVPRAWHVLVGAVVAVGTFVGLGATEGVLLEPSLITFFVGGAVAVTAMILPGVSGSFLLLLLGLWQAVVGAAADRDILLLFVFGVGCVVGLAAFSTLLNWLLARFHDLMLAALIGLMVGSARVLWPFPWDAPFTDITLAAPEGTDSLLALALALTAFSLVWMLGLLATGIQRRRERRALRRAAARGELGGVPPSSGEPGDPADPTVP